MALHEFSVYIVPDNIRYVEKKSIWGFEGESHITKASIVEILRSICEKLKDRGEGFYSDKRCLDIHIIGTGENVKVLEIKGCLSCYMQGIEKIYQIAKACEEKGLKVYFNVLGENKAVGELDSFIQFVCSMYAEKIEFFQKGHMDFCYVIPPSKYYVKLKWYGMRNKFRKYFKR